MKSVNVMGSGNCIGFFVRTLPLFEIRLTEISFILWDKPKINYWLLPSNSIEGNKLPVLKLTK